MAMFPKVVDTVAFNNTVMEKQGLQLVEIFADDTMPDVIQQEIVDEVSDATFERPFQVAGQTVAKPPSKKKRVVVQKADFQEKMTKECNGIPYRLVLAVHGIVCKTSTITC